MPYRFGVWQDNAFVSVAEYPTMEALLADRPGIKMDATGKFVWSRPRNGVHHRVGFYAQYFDYTLPDEREE